MMGTKDPSRIPSLARLSRAVPGKPQRDHKRAVSRSFSRWHVQADKSDDLVDRQGALIDESGDRGKMPLASPLTLKSLILAPDVRILRPRQLQVVQKR